MSKNGNGNDKYPPEVKAAVLADALTGMGIRRIVKKHGLPPSTVATWLRNARTSEARGIALTAQTKENEEELFDLVIDYLRESLRTLRTILQTTADPEWIGRQDARQLAIYLGVVADKAAWYLDALRRSPAGQLATGSRLDGDSEEGPASP